MHRERGWIGEFVEAVDETNVGFFQWLDDVREKIFRHVNVGVADEEDFVFRLAFELNERGNFRVWAE
jgi:hypothetical protein